MTNRLKKLKESDHITVCDKCLTAACWHGEFMCEEARSAGTTIKHVKELRELNLEHEHYWFDQVFKL